MNSNLRNLLGLVGAIAILAVSYAALSYVNAYSESIQPASFRSFSVSGEGKATAVPDVAEFNFQVITEGGTNIASLQSQNTTAINQAIDFLKSQGVASADIKTQYYNLNPRYQTSDCRIYPTPLSAGVGNAPAVVSSTCPPPSIVGYTITQSVDVKVRDFTKIGTIMGGVIKNGANQVGSLSFTIDDPTKVQDQARAEAISKAKDKAQAIAAAGGFTVGRLLSIQEGAPTPLYAPNVMMEAAAKSTGSATPNIQPGSQEVDVTVTMQYEIK